MAMFTAKKNSIGFSIETTLTSSNPKDDLSSASNPVFKMRQSGATVNKVDASFDIVNATKTAIEARYDWVGTDLDTTGIFRVEWWVNIGGKPVKLPSSGYDTVKVSQDLS